MDNAFPGFDHIYLLSRDVSPAAFTAIIELSVDQGILALRAELDIDAPIAAAWKMGRRPPDDCVVCTNAVSTLISEWFITTLQTAGCIGWSSFPVVLSGRKGEPLHGYHGLQVTGRCGPMQWERSSESTKQHPGGVFPVYVGHYFDESQWDGSDVFLSSDRNTAYVFVSEKAADAITNAKLKGLELTRADLVERGWKT